LLALVTLNCFDESVAEPVLALELESIPEFVLAVPAEAEPAALPNCCPMT
jgi:hypothetical protein